MELTTRWWYHCSTWGVLWCNLSSYTIRSASVYVFILNTNSPAISLVIQCVPLMLHLLIIYYLSFKYICSPAVKVNTSQYKHMNDDPFSYIEGRPIFIFTYTQFLTDELKIRPTFKLCLTVVQFCNSSLYCVMSGIDNLSFSWLSHGKQQYKDIVNFE